MAYVFIADDFTGASDTLATLSRGGLRARLFRDVPAKADVIGLDAWGIATEARALGHTEIDLLAARIGRGIAAFAPAFVHVKICSTFDSSLEHGNIARWALGLADATGVRDIAVIGGQPSLGRYAAFGTLFARAPDGAIHRIDRHPIMSCHPVTPMHEADLLRRAKGGDRAMVGHIQRHQRGVLRNPRIAGGGVEFLTEGGLRQLPCQRMFAASRTQKQDIHGPSAQ